MLTVSIDKSQLLRVLQEGVALVQTKHPTGEPGEGILSFYNSPIYEESGRIGGVFTTVAHRVELVKSANGQASDKTNVMKLDNAQANKSESKTFEEQYEELKRSEERYTKMIEEVEDYAIILLDINGIILNWNKGAQKIKGYREDEIIGRNFSIFYLDEDRARNLPQKLIQTAIKDGRATHEGFRIRSDKSRFWEVW